MIDLKVCNRFTSICHSYSLFLIGDQTTKYTRTTNAIFLEEPTLAEAGSPLTNPVQLTLGTVISTNVTIVTGPIQ